MKTAGTVLATARTVPTQKLKVRTISPFTLAAILLGACMAEQRTKTKDSSATGGTAAPPVDSGTAGRAPATSEWIVTPSGIGRIRVGMTVDELRRVAGDFAMPPAGAECTYVRPAGAPRGVSVMLASGQVVRIDVDSAGVRTDAGVAVGDSAPKVEQTYARRITAMPHKYVAGGQYLTVRAVSPKDSTLRIVFESEAGRITRFRSGRAPEVELVERCG